MNRPPGSQANGVLKTLFAHELGGLIRNIPYKKAV
jgi:hypothetical protein